MAKLSEHEKETSINFTEGGREAVVKTFNTDLKHRLAEFVGKYLLFCHLDNFTEEGSVTYVMDKTRLSIRLIPPSGEECRAASKAYVAENGFRSVQAGKETALKCGKQTDCKVVYTHSVMSRSRAAALAQRIVACDNPYWVLSDAKTSRFGREETKIFRSEIKKGGRSETYQTQWQSREKWCIQS